MVVVVSMSITFGLVAAFFLSLLVGGVWLWRVEDAQDRRREQGRVTGYQPFGPSGPGDPPLGIGSGIAERRPDPYRYCDEPVGDDRLDRVYELASKVVADLPPGAPCPLCGVEDGHVSRMCAAHPATNPYIPGG